MDIQVSEGINPPQGKCMGQVVEKKGKRVVIKKDSHWQFKKVLIRREDFLLVKYFQIL